MKRTILVLSLLVSLFIALVFAENVSADGPITDTTAFQVSISDFLTLTVDQTDNIAYLNPVTHFNTGSIVTSVATNNAGGYTIIFEDADDRNGLERAGYSDVPAKNRSPYNIPSVTTATAYADLEDDTYGYYLGNVAATEATYLPIPLYPTEIDSSDEPTPLAVSSTLNFGVKISATRPYGIYEDTIVISAVATPLPGENPFEIAFYAAGKTKDQTTDKYKMQDMTTSICEAITTPTASDYSDTPEIQLVDIRDSKLYWVAKLMDGHCWMTQNLDLDLETSPTNVAPLTHENTDLGWTDNDSSATWTPERSTIVFDAASTTSLSGWSDSYYDPYSADPGVQYIVASDTSNNDSAYYTLEDCKAHASVSTGEECKHYYIGNYYNWTAAIAENDSDTTYLKTQYNIAPNSICPAGWRLPIGRSNRFDSAATREFSQLMLSQGIIANISDVEYATNGFESIRHAPLYLIRGGHIYDGDQRHASFYGRYWSSTADAKSDVYTLYFYPGTINPEQGGTRYYGYSIRCVAR